MFATTLVTLLSASAVSSYPLTGLSLRQASNKAPVIIQMFEWNWNSIAKECTDFIGPAGYTHVQVSTPTEHIQGDQWWTSYQVVSHNLQSKRGSRGEFASMVQTCNQAGVQVLVDIVFNHMAGIDGGSGVAGTSFSHYQYNSLFSSDDFHYCGTPGNDIQNWGDQWQVQNCELANLADLKTESENVKQKLVNLGNDLLSLGVAGFRLDAAKHIPIADLNDIVSRLSRKPFITSEVIGNSNPPASDYASIGQVSISHSFEALRDAFGGQGLASLQGYENGNGVSSGSATTFVATHDSERGGTGGSLNYKSGNNAYTLANVFMLAYPYGTPTVLSSYEFDNGDAGAPNGGYGTCSGAGGAGGFLCQHRWTAIASMVKFRSAVGSAGLTNWQTGSNDQIAFDRDSAGFVAINNGNDAWSASLTTSLPSGTYCDAVAGGKSGSGCAGAQLVVSNGKIQINVPAHSAVAAYGGSKL